EELKANEIYISDQSYSDDNIFDDIDFNFDAEEPSKTVENKNEPSGYKPIDHNLIIIELNKKIDEEVDRIEKRHT
ncbi:MAG: hypothetical protein MHPSP_002450, partial [Paramarteilia canceri]